MRDHAPILAQPAVVRAAKLDFDAQRTRYCASMRPQRIRRHCPSCERLSLVERGDSTCPRCGDPLPVLPGAIP